MKRILALLASLLLAAPALAQTAPELFIFRPGTPIRADEMNANFQLLKDHVTNALGLADLTVEDLDELAQLVLQLQALAESGDLDGVSLEFAWAGSRLGVKREGEEAFTYVDLEGPAGPQGEAGPGLQFQWDGTSLGVRAEGADTFNYVDLVGAQGARGDTGPEGAQGPRGERGPQGIQGEQGARGETGPQGIQGEQGPRGEAGPQGIQGEQGARGETGAQGLQGEQGPRGERGETGPQGAQGEPGTPGAAGPAGADGLDGADGRSIEFTWDGTQLGIKYEGDLTYDYVDLRGPQGLTGPQGETGPQGLQGEPGIQGPAGADGTVGRSIEFTWNGLELGIRYEGDDTYEYVDLRGPQGPTGPAGEPGTAVLNGEGTPDTSLGNEGDFYIDTNAWNIYGPKGDTWGAGSSLVGQDGQDGQDAPTYTATYGIRLDDNNTLSLEPGQHLPGCYEGQLLERYGNTWACSPEHAYYFGANNPEGRNIYDGESIAECVLGDVWLSASRVSHGVEADGRLLSISQNTALYSLIGSVYGGDGMTTFALPDLRDAAPRTKRGGTPVHYVICVEGLFPRHAF